MAPDSTPASRVFPEVSQDLYDAGERRNPGTPDQRDAHAFLRLATRPLKFAQRYLHVGSDAAGRVGRMLDLHRQALQSELDNRPARADFFWRQLRNDFTRLTPDTFAAALAGLEPTAGGPLFADPERARRVLVRELFIETHLAFYSGYADRDEPLTPGSRAFAHFRYLGEWLDDAAYQPGEIVEWLSSPAQTAVDVHRAAGSWAQAVEACEVMLRQCPDARPFQKTLAALCYGRAMSGLKNGEDESGARADAERLSDGIARTEEVRTRFPHCGVAYEYLAHLYHLRAVKLANSGTFSDALRECEKALAHDSSFEEAQQSKATLIDLMKKRQEHAAELEQQVAGQPNAKLNAKGAQICEDARTGFDLVTRYFNSAERTERLEQAYTARARSVWQRIGLAEPSGDFSAHARVLLDVLGQILGGSPADIEALDEAWTGATMAYPELGELDRGLVIAFLERQAFPADEPAPAAEPPALPPGPALAPAAGPARRGGEPFLYWAFSRQNIRIKLQAIAAMVLLLVGSVLSVRSVTARAARDAAYAQVLDGARQQQYLRVIEGAEQFLEHPAIGQPDARGEQVVSLYEEALVRWVAAGRQEIDSGVLAHAEKYRRLVKPQE